MLNYLLETALGLLLLFGLLVFLYAGTRMVMAAYYKTKRDYN